MCGHGTIGIITFGIEHGLIHPAEPGRVRAEVPAGLIDIRYEQSGNQVTSVRITNIASYVAARDIRIDVEGIGPLTVDISYGGNFYAIVEPQGSYAGLDAMGAARLLDLSPKVRAAVRELVTPVHPVDPTIQGVSHVLWADTPKGEGAHGRNAVFYGDRAIDRSPCGTGTSARIAHLHAAGRLSVGESFVHESYIGSRFTGRIEREVMLGDHPAIIPSIEGSAIATGLNTIWIDEEDLFWRGFQVT